MLFCQGWEMVEGRGVGVVNSTDIYISAYSYV